MQVGLRRTVTLTGDNQDKLNSIVEKFHGKVTPGGVATINSIINYVIHFGINHINSVGIETILEEIEKGEEITSEV